MDINELSKFRDVRFGEDINSVFESNSLVEFKIKDNYTIETEIEYQLSNKYIGDFHSLLLEIGVPVELLYITTVLNGMYSSNDFNGGTNKVYLIDPNFVGVLLNKIPDDFRIPTI